MDGAVQLGEDQREDEDGRRPARAVGDGVGLPRASITFPREPGRVTLERIEARWPRLIPTLREHPGIGFLLVRSERHGAVVLGPRATNYLDEDRVEGEDPLAPFGPNAARHVRRTDGFPHCPDIVRQQHLLGRDRRGGGVRGARRLARRHGRRRSRSRSRSSPPSGQQPDEPVVGAEAMHAHFRRWLADLGHDSYRDKREREEATA